MALGVLVCVLAVFVFPLTDLPGTALRSVQKARLLALHLAAAASVPTLPSAVLVTGPAPAGEATPLRVGAELLALTCARLC